MCFLRALKVRGLSKPSKNILSVIVGAGPYGDALRRVRHRLAARVFCHHWRLLAHLLPAMSLALGRVGARLFGTTSDDEEGAGAVAGGGGGARRFLQPISRCCSPREDVHTAFAPPLCLLALIAPPQQVLPLATVCLGTYSCIPSHRSPLRV